MNNETLPSRMRGFTLQELVVIILIIGILSVVAVPRLVNRSAFELPGFQQELASAMRYAQKYAFVSGCPVRVSIAGGGFELRRSSSCHAGDFSVPMTHPVRGGDFSVSAPSGLTLSPAGNVTFRGTGAADADATISLASGAGSRQVEVIGATGYVDIL